MNKSKMRAKKILSVSFLLILTLLASTHATLAFHFCDGSLQSVNIADDENDLCCCKEKKHHESNSGEDAIHNVPCCSNHYLEIGADGFPATEQVVTAVNDKYFHQTAPLPCHVFGLNGIYAKNIVQHISSPPGNAVMSGIDLLIFVGILTI